MNTKIKNQIIKLSEENPNEEICGFIYHTLSDVFIYPARNIADNREEFFLIDPKDFIKCEGLGQIIGIYHSHVNYPSVFSPDDIETSEEWILPMYVYSLQDKMFKEYRPKNYKVSLEGRPFIWGTYDCFSIVRDYFWQNFNIHISDYDRDETFNGSNKSIILDNFEKEDFHSVGDLSCFKKHDVLLYTSRQFYPHHFSIFLGNSRVLEHCMHRLSEVSMVGGNRPMKLHSILRYNHPL